MSDEFNEQMSAQDVFRGMADGTVETKKRAGRPKAKPPVGETAKDKPEVGETKHAKRKPVGLRSPINRTPTRKGFKRRWVNDREDRIQMFKDGGYAPVQGDDGQIKTRRAGSGVTAVLMEIDEELYNEDQQAKYKKWNRDAQERLKPREGAGYYQPKTKM